IGSRRLRHRLNGPDVATRIWHAIGKNRGAKTLRCAIASCMPSRRLIPLANVGKRAQPVATDESVRAANCSS
ncbi:MAG TPA: hypothetical protein VIZ90_03740, partial [Rhizobiaceae bacterium]